MTLRREELEEAIVCVGHLRHYTTPIDDVDARREVPKMFDDVEKALRAALAEAAPTPVSDGWVSVEARVLQKAKEIVSRCFHSTDGYAKIAPELWVPFASAVAALSSAQGRVCESCGACLDTGNCICGDTGPLPTPPKTGEAV